jgi:hypothetical protein
MKLRLLVEYLAAVLVITTAVVVAKELAGMDMAHYVFGYSLGLWTAWCFLRPRGA